VTLYFAYYLSIVSDINIGFNSSSVSNITKAGNNFYFSADDGVHGYELWKSDGTITQLVSDINPGPNSSYPGYLSNSNGRGNMVVVNGTLFFTADDGSHGIELWKIDSLGNAVMVKDINPGAEHGLWFGADDENSKHINLVSINSTNIKLFFAADDGNGWELWVSDGTSDGTSMVKKINQKLHTNNYPYSTWYGSNPEYLTVINNILYFSATDDWEYGQELWKSDGSPSGTVMVKDINDNILLFSSNDKAGVGSNPEKLINANGVLYFVANDSGVDGSGSGKELWKHDPISNTTSVVSDINPGFYGSDPSNFEQVGTNLFFTAKTDGMDNELYKCSILGGNATLVKNINPAASSTPSNLTNFKNKLYFTADDGANGKELWVSDGNPNGTFLINDINQGPNSSNPKNLTVVGSFDLYFSANDGIYGDELWGTNGLLNDAIIIENIASGSNSSYINNLTDVNGTLYFSAYYKNYGNELLELVGSPLGLKEQSLKTKIKIYPNPSNDLIIIENNNEQLSSTYVILNSIGQRLLSGKLTDKTTKIDLNSLSSGIYFIKIGETVNHSLKLIKK
jgi:ELWxxDGT repeat protein